MYLTLPATIFSGAAPTARGIYKGDTSPLYLWGWILKEGGENTPSLSDFWFLLIAQKKQPPPARGGSWEIAEIRCRGRNDKSPLHYALSQRGGHAHQSLRASFVSEEADRVWCERFTSLQGIIEVIKYLVQIQPVGRRCDACTRAVAARDNVGDASVRQLAALDIEQRADNYPHHVV